MGNTRINRERFEDWKQPPEETLSLLVESRLGVAVDPSALREFILSDWRRVSTLAHRIMTKPDTNAPAPQMEA